MKLKSLSLLLTLALSVQLNAESLDVAKGLLQSKKYTKASELLEKLLQEGAADLPKDEAIYLSARASYLNKNYAKARALAQRVVDDFQQSKWLTKSIFLIADSLHAENKHEDAVKLYRELLADILKQERKVEIANKLTKYADSMSSEEKQDGVVVRKADYESAYNLYREVLGIECGHDVREEVRLKMIDVRFKQKRYHGIESECLAYLGDFDDQWRGKIGSVDRIMSRKPKTFKQKGDSVSLIRYRLAESLHRQSRRKLATMYLNELIKGIKDSSLDAPKGLLADVSWLRLFTLTQEGGRPNDLNYWTKEARAYLKEYPTHINSHMTARLIASYAEKWGDKEEAKKLYEEFIQSAFGAEVVENPNTIEKESEKEFVARRSAAGRNIESALYALGQLHIKAKDFEAAKETLNQCLRQFPNGQKWPVGNLRQAVFFS